jgi:hypothetical protein
MHEDGLNRLGVDKKRAIKVYAAVLGTGISRPDDDDTQNVASVLAARHTKWPDLPGGYVSGRGA